MIACGCPIGRRKGCDRSQSEPVPLIATVRRRGAGPATPSCLHAVGRRLEHALFNRAPLHLLPLLKPTHVLSEAVAVANRDRRQRACDQDDVNQATLTYQQALVLVASHLQHYVATGDLTAATVSKMTADMAALTRNMTDGRHQPFVAATSSADVAKWIDSTLGGPRRNGEPAAATTRRLRRSAARLFFKTLRQLGVYTGDPTIDISVPEANSSRTVPLSDLDLVYLRLACVIEAAETRLPAVLALLESGATTGEVAKVRVRDVDLALATVFLRGNKRRRARTNPLSPWAHAQLRLRIQSLRADSADDDTLLAYGGDEGEDSETPGVSAARAAHQLLVLAELVGEPGVRPGSIPAALGKRVWDTHRGIGLVARVLGLRSINAAAAAIGVDVDAEVRDAEARLRQCVLGNHPAASYQRGRKPPHRRGRKSRISASSPVRPRPATGGRLVRSEDFGPRSGDQ